MLESQVSSISRCYISISRLVLSHNYFLNSRSINVAKDLNNEVSVSQKLRPKTAVNTQL